MRRAPVRPRAQRVLNLERRTAEPPIAPGSTTALLETLADLLLEALGGEKAEVSGQEGAADAADHA